MEKKRILIIVISLLILISLGWVIKNSLFQERKNENTEKKITVVHPLSCDDVAVPRKPSKACKNLTNPVLRKRIKKKGYAPKNCDFIELKTSSCGPDSSPKTLGTKYLCVYRCEHHKKSDK